MKDSPDALHLPGFLNLSAYASPIAEAPSHLASYAQLFGYLWGLGSSVPHACNYQ
jgi:hypothetical protein